MAGNYGVRIMVEESVSAVTATATVELGAERQSNNLWYRYVYNSGNSQINPGYAVIPNVATTTGYSCTLSSATGDIALGFVNNATLTTGTYGWVVFRGPMTGLVKTSSNTAIISGTMLTLGPNGVILSAPTAGSGTDYCYGISARCITSYGSASTGGYAFVNC